MQNRSCRQLEPEIRALHAGKSGVTATHLVAVDIIAVWAFHTLKDDGLSANRLEGTDW